MEGVRCKSIRSVFVRQTIFLLVASNLACADLLVPDSLGGAWQKVDITSELLQDGAFSNGPADWQSSGTIPNVTGQVILWDSVYPSGLWQPVAIGDAYRLTLSFRIRYDLLSDAFTTGTFPDFFVASLEFTSDPASFSLFGGGVDAIILGSVDALSGLRDLAPGLLLEPDPSEPDWQLVTFETQPLGLFATPFFRLFDENMVTGDSRVIISDVSLVAHIVPEPESLGLWLGFVGLVCSFITRRKKSNSSLCR